MKLLRGRDKGAQLVEAGVAERDLAQAIASLGDPATLITGPPIVIALGRRGAGDG